MDKFCLLSAVDRQPYFETAATNSGYAIGIVEKDFWVCWTLKHLFALPDISDHLIFKGGTTLSKVYGIIDRFSEDIDISIDRKYFGFTGDKDPEKAGSAKKQKQLIEELAAECSGFVQKQLLSELRNSIAIGLNGTDGWDLVVDEDDPDKQTILFNYPAVGVQTPGYIAQSVKIEMGARSDHWPAHTHAVQPYVATNLPAGAIANPTVEVKALDAARTFWEKATILHLYAYWPQGKTVTPRQSRHYYDLFRLIQSKHKAEALSQPELLKRVAEHKRIYFRAAWAKYDEAVPGTLRLVPNAEVENEMRRDYNLMKEMFFADPPEWDEIMAAVRALEAEVNANV